MVKAYFVIIAFIFVTYPLSECSSVGIELSKKVQVAKKAILKLRNLHLSVTNEKLLGGKPINMTEEPKSIVDGLCPLGCSK